jgi:hypothetical protein
VSCPANAATQGHLKESIDELVRDGLYHKSWEWPAIYFRGKSLSTKYPAEICGLAPAKDHRLIVFVDFGPFLIVIPQKQCQRYVGFDDDRLNVVLVERVAPV